MNSRCCNPRCCTPLYELHPGKVFAIEMQSADSVLFLRLCSDCAALMELSGQDDMLPFGLDQTLAVVQALS